MLIVSEQSVHPKYLLCVCTKPIPKPIWLVFHTPITCQLPEHFKIYVTKADVDGLLPWVVRTHSEKEAITVWVTNMP